MSSSVEASQTNYTYTASFAVAICAGEIDEVEQIWTGPILIHDKGISSKYRVVYADDTQADDYDILIFKGTETQEPCAEIGDGCAYRGVAYAVFKNFDLSKYGNMIPPLSFTVKSKPISLKEQTDPRFSEIWYKAQGAE